MATLDARALTHRLLRSGLNGGRTLVKRSRLLRDLIYDARNRASFTGFAWHERMLADSKRVHAYRKGIADAVKPGDVVVDLGTGTGILAMYAAASGARHVYAIDHSDFIEVAQEIGRRNGFKNITWVKSNSREFVCPEPPDLLIHEQMGHTIVGENLIVNLLDLKRRILKPGGRILPARFQLLAAPVSLDAQHRHPFLWEIDDVGVDLSFLEGHPSRAKYSGADHATRLVYGCQVERLLAEPQVLIEFDLNAITGEDDLPSSAILSWPIRSAGVMDGLIVWFRTVFENGEGFDTHPLGRQTNWLNTVLRTPLTPLQPGDCLTRQVVMTPLKRAEQWQVRALDAGDETAAGRGRRP